MHLLLVVSSVAVVVLTGSLGLRVLRRVRGWQARRDVQVLVLAAPLVSLGLGIAGIGTMQRALAGTRRAVFWLKPAAGVVLILAGFSDTLTYWLL